MSEEDDATRRADASGQRAAALFERQQQATGASPMRRTALMQRLARAGEVGKAPVFYGLAVGLIGWLLIVASSPSHSLELSTQQAAIYSAASIFPPTAQRMTVCYGFGCRRREMLDFTAADRAVLNTDHGGGSGDRPRPSVRRRRKLDLFDIAAWGR